MVPMQTSPKGQHTRIRAGIGGFSSKVGSFLIAISCLSGVMNGAVVSAETLSYVAAVSAGEATLAPGESKQITLKFKNVGTQTWTGSVSKTAVYLYGRASVFGHPSWLKDDLPGPIAQASVKPGQMASATFWVKAPPVPGTYTERFLLSYGPNAWIKGSVVTATFRVAPAAQTQVAVATPTSASSASAPADSTEWKAQLVDKGGIEWQLDPGGHAIVTLAYKNVGTKTWTRDGKSFVSLYTGKGNRKSAFKDFSWKNEFQAALMKEATVRPGDVGHFLLELRAPDVPGTYQESFQLAAEDTAWMGGGTVTLPIRVTMPREYIAKGIPNGGDPSSPQTGNYRASLLLKSTPAVTLSGNGRLALTYGFKNTGTATWNTLALRIASVVPALSGTLSSVRDDSWMNGAEPVRTNKVTAPGEIGFIGFTIKAPPKKGTYTATFKLMADNQPVEEGQIDIPITVTSDGYIEPEPSPTVVTAPSTPSPFSPLMGDASNLPAEPIIRVGIFATTDDRMVVRAVSGGFSLQQNGSAVCRFTSGQSVTVTFDRTNRVYKASGDGCTTQSSAHYVAVHDDGLSPLEMTDFFRPVSWLPGANDNKFRGKLELRFTPVTDKVWVINELPVEWYLKGIAETSNSSPQEYQRALLTAARTYAMYHVQRGTKHAAEFYTVDATYDQVYRGYGAEARGSNIVAAVDATRGQVVTYEGKLAITPYYSRSDGRTRDWTEVWGGGPYGWLKSVPVPWDQGKTLWGHGVGLSATGALGAANDGWTYDRILKYFYTGIELKRIYQ